MIAFQEKVKESSLRNVVVDISAFEVSNNPEEVLVTYSLGSCLGLAIYDPVVQVAGLIHCMLPLSRIDTDKAKVTPGMFVETGVPALLEAAFKLGATRKNLILKAAGCGQPLDDKGLFRIGERNHTVLRKLLWKNNLLLTAEDIGGKQSRTMKLYVETGELIIRSRGMEELL